MPGLTLLGLLNQDDKHTIKNLTYSFAPNKFLAKQIKDLTSAAFHSGKKMTRCYSRATIESEDLV